MAGSMLSPGNMRTERNKTSLLHTKGTTGVGPPKFERHLQGDYQGEDKTGVIHSRMREQKCVEQTDSHMKQRVSLSVGEKALGTTLAKLKLHYEGIGGGEFWRVLKGSDITHFRCSKPQVLACLLTINHQPYILLPSLPHHSSQVPSNRIPG